MDADKLKTLGIVSFEYFKDSLDLCNILIGNGFSINLCDRLSYTSLFTMFKEGKSKDLITLFSKLKTTNFELVIEILNNTMLVNNIYGVDNKVYSVIVDELKNGLIEVINHSHPLYKEIDPDVFRSLSEEMSQFNDIFTTNYDIFLYRIILARNELIDLGRVKGIKYKDDFCEEIGEHILRYGYFDEVCKKIYYLHGSLFIYNQNYTYKYRKGGESDEYIRLLKREIENGNFPLFVTEGTPADKYNAISNNYYLSSCLNKLRNSKSQLVVYGLSFQPSDKHIIDSINSSRIDQIFISFYVGNKTDDEIKHQVSRYKTMFPMIEVELYDSTTLFSFYPKYQFS